ncbi:MAG TPA: adenylate/guanylate cyclase domain-containing protein [Hyphomicrobiaceae bacterium]|nr:adenylate/guanylate cyclase domain-containing protein [Hyphomicrobiaceae bacterium]
MPTTATAQDQLTGRREGRGALAWERDIRLGAGLILFAFVLTHLLNHAVGVFGVELMEVVQGWRVNVWRSWPGTIALYGAFVVHMGLALKRIASRRTFRMPLQEAVQIVLGLLIPILLLEHLVATRYLSDFHSVDDRYRAELQQLWPSNAIKQTLLLLVVWFHGVIGIDYAFRSRSWFPRVREAGLVIACAVPLLALAGFVSSGREARVMEVPTAAWTEAQRDAFTDAVTTGGRGLLIVGAALLAVILARVVYLRLSHRIRVTYVGHGEVRAAAGQTLLEVSRANRIPHPSLCGGRARCSTCRVLVLSGQETLPAPTLVEQRVLHRIAAPARVRLACQLRPKQDVTIQVLLPAIARRGMLDWDEEAYKWGVERTVTVLIVDVRGFTTLTRRQLPSDIVVLLNRLVGELTQTVEARGGKVGMYLSDGLMAIFGLGTQLGSASKAAIYSALDMLKAVRTLNGEFGSALPMPLRVGIGIHTGPAVIARIGDEERGYMTTALGETVSVASRLEAATKELLADCIISQECVDASGLSLSGPVQKEIHIRECEKPITVHALADVEELEAALRIWTASAKRASEDAA